MKEVDQGPQICIVNALDLLVSNYPFILAKLSKNSLASPTALEKYRSVRTLTARASEYIESIYQ